MLTLQIAATGEGAPPIREVAVAEQKVLLGRASHCNIVLDRREFGASSEHARIERIAGVYYLFDQGSTNGTSLNGTRVRPHTSTPLANNDKVYIGRWVLRCLITRQTSRIWHEGLEADPRAVAFLAEISQAGVDPQLLDAAIAEQVAKLEPHERSNMLRMAVVEARKGPVHDALMAYIHRREAIHDACYEAMTSLSAHLTGLDRFNSPEEVMRFFRLADQSLELLLEWIVGCISSRRTFEERFSAKVTRFFGMDANPIKHALTPSQAGRYLLNWEEERDAEQIKKNLETALNDLTTHQLAIVGGVQAALRKAIERLDPTVQEKKSSGSWLGGPFARAKNWDQFKAAYTELVENEAKLFNEIIYPALREGYLQAHEDQREGGPASSDPDGTQVLI